MGGYLLYVVKKTMIYIGCGLLKCRGIGPLEIASIS
jgi:hypothetical protein